MRRASYIQSLLTGAGGLPPILVFKSRFAQFVAGTLGRDLRIAILGNSTETGAWWNNTNAWTNNRQGALSNLLAAKFAAAGYSVSNANMFADNNSGTAGTPTTLPNDPRVTMGAGWSWASAFAGWGIAGNTAANSTNANKFQFTPTEAWNTCIVGHRVNSVFGSMSIAAAGGAAITTVDTAVGTTDSLVLTTVSTGGAAAVQSVDLFKSVAGDGKSIRPFSIHCYDTAAPKIAFWNWGLGSGSSYTWAGIHNTSPDNPLTSIGQYAPDLTVICTGINDSNTNTPLATFLSNYQLTINAAKATGDVIICPPAWIGTANGLVNDPIIIPATQTLAKTNGLRFVDFSSSWPSYAFGLANGFYQTAAPDMIHWRATGMNVRANGIFLYMIQ